MSNDKDHLVGRIVNLVLDNWQKMKKLGSHLEIIDSLSEIITPVFPWEFVKNSFQRRDVNLLHKEFIGFLVHVEPK